MLAPGQSDGLPACTGPQCNVPAKKAEVALPFMIYLRNHITSLCPTLLVKQFQKPSWQKECQSDFRCVFKPPQFTFWAQNIQAKFIYPLPKTTIFSLHYGIRLEVQDIIQIKSKYYDIPWVQFPGRGILCTVPLNEKKIFLNYEIEWQVVCPTYLTHSGGRGIGQPL